MNEDNETIKTTQVIDGEEVSIFIEVDKDTIPRKANNDVRADFGRSARKAIDVSKDVLGDGLSLARLCAVRVVDTMQNLHEKTRPHEFEVQFSIKLEAEAGAVLTKIGAEAHMQVTMKWTSDKE